MNADEGWNRPSVRFYTGIPNPQRGMRHQIKPTADTQHAADPGWERRRDAHSHRLGS
jgi:hypothetical protein